MTRTKHERIKMYFLILLVVTSLSQVGILWNYQTHEFPTNFLASFFFNKNIKQSVDITYYFNPYRIIISEGFDERQHWVINKTNVNYNKLWDEAKYYLTEIFKGNKLLSKTDYSYQKWGDLIVKKAFVFEFKTILNQNLLKDFLQIDEMPGDIPKGIYKMIILPFEDLNNNLTIYIYDGEKIFKYTPSINQKRLSKLEYDNFITKFSKDVNLQSFAVVKEVIPNKEKIFFDINPEILVVVEGNKFRNFKEITCKIPDVLISQNTNNNSDLLKIADIILGNDKDNYDFGVDINGTIVFKNLNNVFRIYKNGLFEYRYLNNIEENDKGSQSSSLENIVKFINDRKNLIPNNNIFLSQIEEKKNEAFYTFKFDYKIGDHSVLFSYNDINDKNLVKTYAISISANSKRVLSCTWILKDFKEKKQTKRFNVSFDNLLNNNNLLNNFSIKDIDIEYIVLPTIIDPQELCPVWVIKTMENENNVILMSEK